MSVEDESITAAVKVASEVTLTCADALKLLIKLLAGSRAANGEGLVSGVKRLGSNVVGWVDTKRNLDRDGKGNVGQVSWDKTGNWEDKGTYTIASNLADPENIDVLRDRLKKLGVTFAAERQPNGDVLFLYHLRDKDLVNTITAPLVKEWAGAVGLDPDNEDMVRDAAVSEGIFDSPEQYDEMMSDADLLPTPITPQPVGQRDQMAPGAVASQAQEDAEDEDMYVDPSEYDQLEAEFQAQQADPGLADALAAEAAGEHATPEGGPNAEATAETGPEWQDAASLRDGFSQEGTDAAPVASADMSPDELIGSAQADIAAERTAAHQSIGRKPTVTPTSPSHGGIRR